MFAIREINMATAKKLGAIKEERTAMEHLAKSFGRYYGLFAERAQYQLDSITGFRSVDQLLVEPRELEMRVTMAESIAINTLKKQNHRAIKYGLDPLLPHMENLTRKQKAFCILRYVEKVVQEYSTYAKLTNASGK